MSGVQPSTAMAALAEYERDVDGILNDIETQIQDAEADYLHSTAAFGNVIMGFDNLDGRQARMGLGAGMTSDRDRPFSSSSVTGSAMGLGEIELGDGGLQGDGGAHHDALEQLADPGRAGLADLAGTGAGGPPPPPPAMHAPMATQGGNASSSSSSAFDYGAPGASASHAPGGSSSAASSSVAGGGSAGGASAMAANSGSAGPTDADATAGGASMSEAASVDLAATAASRKRRRAADSAGDQPSDAGMGIEDNASEAVSAMDDATADGASLASAGGRAERRSGRARRTRKPRSADDDA
jgi:hypothetical protein